MSLFARPLLLFGCLLGLSATERVLAQQFNSDNQWVAPHGVETLVATVGENYSQAILVGALIPDWEFNLQLTHYYDEPDADSDAYTVTNVYAKHRLSENEAETAGYAFIVGTGVFPDHREEGERMRALESWYVTGIATYSFLDDQLMLDFLPGVVVNTDQGPGGDTAWGFTYSSRLTLYGVIPSSALVAEVFGTEGDAESKPGYRFGVRWESPHWIVAGTYSGDFSGAGGAGFELGILYLTDKLF